MSKHVSYLEAQSLLFPESGSQLNDRCIRIMTRSNRTDLDETTIYGKLSVYIKKYMKKGGEEKRDQFVRELPQMQSACSDIEDCDLKERLGPDTIHKLLCTG